MLSRLIQRPDTRQHWRELIALLDEEPFSTDDDLDLEQEQRRTYAQFKILNQWAGTGAALLNDRNRLFTALEFAAVVNPSLFHVAQVHYAVCLASILELGSPSQQLQILIGELNTLTSIGTILITELGKGNSHLAVGTRAVYEPATDQFLLSTPSNAARKFMPNVALSGVGKIGMVIAQLWCGEKNYGVFPFLVPIRDTKKIFPGIQITQLPGNSAMSMDYALVNFSDVRVPSAWWLNDTATLSGDATVVDPLDHSDRRLIRSLGVGSSNASTSAAVGTAAVARACIWIAIRYAMQRITMGRLAPGKPILVFRNQQHQLFSAVAEAYVATCLVNRLVLSQSPSLDQTKRQLSTELTWAPWSAINHHAAITKAICADSAGEVIKYCRRASGAQGAMAGNRFGKFDDMVIAYASAAGDNRLILLDIGRDLAAGNSYTPLDVALPSDLNSPDKLLQLARAEEYCQYQRVSAGLETCLGEGGKPIETWNPRLIAAIELARTYGQRLAIEGMLEMAPMAGSERETVEALATVYVVNHFGTRLPYEITDRVLGSAFDKILPKIDLLMDAFDFSYEMIRAPMAEENYSDMYI
jgi:acyl-CoA oxidase